MKLDFIKEKLNSAKIGIVSEEKTSTDLFKWCDIVISWGTSILVQGLMMNKSAIYAQFINPNSTYFKKYCPNIVATDINDFNKKFNILINYNQELISYNDKKKLYKHMIYGGNSHESIIEKYINYFSIISS